MFTFRKCLRSTTCTHCLCTTPNPNDRNTEIVSSTNKWLNCIFSNKLNYNVSLKNINWRQYDLKNHQWPHKMVSTGLWKRSIDHICQCTPVVLNWLQLTSTHLNCFQNTRVHNVIIFVSFTSIDFSSLELTSMTSSVRRMTSINLYYPSLPPMTPEDSNLSAPLVTKQ